MPSRTRILGALLALLLAGSTSSALPAYADSHGQENLVVGADGEIYLDVPVQVVLIGFEPGTGAELAQRLSPERVWHSALDWDRAVPPRPGSLPLFGWLLPIPIRPRAVFDVHEAPLGLVEGFRDFLPSTGPLTALDANAVEDWLAEELPARGVPLSVDTPTLVFLHAGSEMQGQHSYRVTYPGGWVDSARVFGERHPLLVMDVSAFAYDYAPLEDFVPEYERPLDPGGAETVRLLEEAARDAVHLRLLQGSVYPVPTKPCQAITLVMATRTGVIADHLPGYTRSEDLLDVDRLADSFAGLVGDVHVDTVLLDLPVDDPVLDALSRGFLATTDPLHWWIDENWDRYWVPHEGCEAYVSIMVLSDATETINSWGVGMYDVTSDRRVSLSVVTDLHRLIEETDPDPSRSSFNWVNYLFAHETGHLLGLRHPHDTTNQDGSGRYNMSWSTVRTAMTYAVADRCDDFGAIDRTNWLRNRAGWAMQAAVRADLRHTPEFWEAYDHISRYEWEAAGDVLIAALHG